MSGMLITLQASLGSGNRESVPGLLDISRVYPRAKIVIGTPRVVGRAAITGVLVLTMETVIPAHPPETDRNGMVRVYELYLFHSRFCVEILFVFHDFLQCLTSYQMMIILSIL